MKLPQTINKFYDSIEKLEIMGNNIKEKRDEVSDSLKKFSEKIEAITIDNSLKKQNEELYKIFDDAISTTKDKLKVWFEDIEKQNNNENFREELKDKFIVIIFGKVKAGKSTLGNFIATQSTLKEKAKFFSYDEVGNKKESKKLEEIDENDGFKTDNLECTSSIQGFYLGGLAWIDTPGLGSMTEENGQLAKDYINSADYIIFPTSSAQVLLDEELEQVKELIEQNKHLTICITRSDDTERKKDKDGKSIKDENGNIKRFIVNKNSEGRKLQEDSAKKRLSEKINDDNIDEIFSISVMCSKEGIKTDNQELFDKSNIEIFYKKMLDIVESKAEYLKSNTPFENLKAFIDNKIIGEEKSSNTLSNIKNDFSKVNFDIAELNKTLENKIKNINLDIVSVISQITSKYANDINSLNYKEKFKIIDNEISQNIEELISSTIRDIFKAFEISMYDFKKSSKNDDEFEIKQQYKNIQVKYDKSGFWRRLGNKIGLCDLEYETLTNKIHIGDNKEEIVSHFKNKRVEEYSKEVKAIYKNIQNDFFDKFQKIKKNIDEVIAELEKNLNNITKER